MTHPQTTLFGRRTLLKGAAGLSLAALASAAAAVVAVAGGGSSSKTLKMLYFGEQTAATELQNRLQPEISKLDPEHQVRDRRDQRHGLERLPGQGPHPGRRRHPAGHHQRRDRGAAVDGAEGAGRPS